MSLLLNNTEENFLLLDPEARILLFNHHFQKMYTLYFGRPVVKGNSILDHAQPHRREIVKNIVSRVLNGEIVESELEFTIPGGKIHTYNARYKPAFNEEGKIAGVFLTVQDITRSKRAEQQLIFNERRFRRLVENGNEAIAILSPTIQPNYISPSVYRILGYTPEELMEMDVLSLVYPEDVSIIKEALAIAMASPGVTGEGHIVRALHKNQTWRWLEASLTNMLHDPAIGSIVDNFRDVTEKKQAEEKIRIAKERYDTVLKATNEAVWEWDIPNNEVYWGEGFRYLFGYDPEKISMNVLSIRFQKTVL